MPTIPNRPRAHERRLHIGEPVPDIRALAAGLGMPSTAAQRCIEITTRGAVSPRTIELYARDHANEKPLTVPRAWLKNWTGYCFDVFGTIVTRLPRDRQEYPAWRLTLTDDTDIIIQVWRLRAAQPASLLCAEITWNPDRGVLPVIREVQAAWYRPEWNPADDLRSAGQAMRKLYDLIVRPGRPEETPERAWARLLDAGRRALRRNQIDPEQLTRPMIAFELNRKAPPGKDPRADDVWTRAGKGLPDLKRALEDGDEEDFQEGGDFS